MSKRAVRRASALRMLMLGLIGMLLAVITTGMFALIGDLHSSSGKPAGMGTNATTAPSENPYIPHPGEAATNSGLQVQVVGKCTDKGGLRLKASGFTPNGEIHITAKFPDGTNYPYLPKGGLTFADASGAIPDWSWDCMNTPGGFGRQSGDYTLTVKDSVTTKSVTVTFRPWVPTAVPSTNPSPGASN